MVWIKYEKLNVFEYVINGENVIKREIKRLLTQTTVTARVYDCWLKMCVFKKRRMK